MKKKLLGAGFVLLLMTPVKAMAAGFSEFYVFGDSLSDTGNLLNITQELGGTENGFPPDPPYFAGRFSNNDIWVDYVGDEIGLTPTLFTNPNTTSTQGINYAVGGASSGLGNALLPEAPFPGVLAQVGLFTQPLIENNQQVNPNALFAVWGGAPDYLFTNDVDQTEVINNLSNSIGLLAQAGAKNIMVFNLPDLGQIPFAAQGNPSQLTSLSTSHNAKLKTVLENFSSNPDLNIIPVDTNSLFDRALANPQEFGFQNTTDPCVVGSFEDVGAGNFTQCSNPNDFLFFDAVHPTSSGHRLIADAALSRVKTVPEPATALSILGVGAVSATVLKRKKREHPNEG